MIQYDVNEDRIIARFDFASFNKIEKQYWIDNITNNIIRKYDARPFRHLIYTLARDCVCKRSTLYGKMNEPPNEEVGKRIAKQRLLAKYNDLEQKVAKKFLECIKELKCVKSLEDSVTRLTQILARIEGNIASYYKLVRYIIANEKGELF